MIKISKEQLAAFELQVIPILKSEYTRKLIEMYPERTAQLGRDRVRSMVEEAFTQAQALEIEPGKEVFRMVNLRFLPGFDITAPAIHQAVHSVLGNTSRSGEKRLDFIYNHLVPLPPARLPASIQLKTPVLEPPPA